MAKTPTRILLLKEKVDFSDALENPASCHSKEYKKQNAKLYWKLPPAHPPKWVENLFPDDKELQKTLSTRSISAVLVVNYKKETFAITFGHGKGLLKQSLIEPRFGLKVVLNRVEPESLRSIDTKSLDGFLSQTREQVPALSPLSSFGIDIEKDFIKAVTGTSSQKAIGQTITGAESFFASLEISLENISPILDELIAAAVDTKYKENFEFIDNISEVPRSLSAELNSKLIEKIKNSETERIWLAPPDIMEWEDHAGFCFRGNGKSFEDISLESYLEERIKKLDTLSIGQLKNHKIIKLNVEFQETSKWNVYSCLYAEIEDGAKRYILSDSKWFEVDENYVKKVQEYLDRSLNKWEGEAFPAYRTDEMVELNEEGLKGETRYNSDLAKSGKYDLLDGNLITHGEANSKIELCDLHDTNLYIHVKRYTRSSGLSHLFNQGKVSAELLCSDVEFRQKAIAKLIEISGKSEITKDRPEMTQIHVVFAVISASSKDLKLPFFSQVALKNTVHFLKNTLDVGKVSLVKIQALN